MTSTGSPRRVPPGRVKLISAWFTIWAVVTGLIGARAILIFAFPAVLPGSDPYLAFLGVSFGSSVGVDLAGEAFLFCGLGLLNSAAAVGLLRLRGWARWLAIGLAAPALILFPFQLSPSPVLIIVGALIIWYLLTDKAKQAFRAPP